MATKKLRMKFFCYTLTLGFLCCTNLGLFAQSPQPFWTEDFSGAQTPPNWTTNDPSGNNALWQHCSTPNNCPIYILNESNQLQNTVFHAPSAENGLMWMNSEALGNLSTPHLSQLSTPAIDCSTQSEVWVEFYSQITTSTLAPFGNAVLRVATSNTPSTEWTTFPLYNNLIVTAISSLNPQPIKIDISEIAANQSTVYIQWQWRGDFEFAWSLDDIALYNEKPRPENAIWYEDFCNGLEDWEISTEFNDIPWDWHPSGNLGEGVFSNASHYLHSPTAYNGVAILDYDLLVTSGDPGNIPNFPYPLVKAELISPTLDLSNINVKLDLEFYQVIRRLNAVGNNAFSSVSVSIDNGDTWQDPLNVNPFLFVDAPPLNNKIYLPLSDIEGEAEVKIKFTYYGDFYYWAIDDIVLIERPANDLMVESNYFAISPNYSTPYSQTNPIHFLADFTNIGSETQDSVQFSVKIEQENTTVFQTQDFYPSVAVNTGNMVSLFEETFLPLPEENSIGQYKGIYEVSNPNEDFRPENDTLGFVFEISDSTFAKENGVTGNVAPFQTPSYSIGNVFYIPNGEGWYARYISFAANEPPGISNEGKRVEVLLFEWDGQSSEEFVVNSETEMLLVAGGDYTFQSGDADRLITIPIFDEVALKDDTYYVPVIRYQSFTGQPLPMSVNRNFNYRATHDLTTDLGRTQFASAVDIGNNGLFNLAGFEPVFQVIPVIRLHIGPTPVATKDIPLPYENKIAIQPNPVRDNLQLDINLIKPADKIRIKLLNLQGHIVLNHYLSHFQKGRVDFSVRHLPSGTYFLHIRTDSGVRTEKVTIF